MHFHSFFTHHSFWGKLIGGFFGFLMAGPAGALFGILIGNFFDKGLSQHLNRPYWELYTHKNTPLYNTFIKTTFLTLGYLAKAEGRVSERAIEHARALMTQFKLNRAEIKAAQADFQMGKSKQFNLVQSLLTLKQSAYANPNLIMTFLSIQYQAARKDGLSFARLQALNQVFQTLGFATLNQQRQYYQDEPFSYHSYEHERPSSRSNTLPLSEAYSILELSPSASQATIKQAYRRLISRNHPDKLIAKGKSEQEIKFANEKTQKIRKAYETICAEKGWRSLFGNYRALSALK